MKNLISRFIKEENADLAMWITLIIFLLITVAAYIIVWPWAQGQIDTSTKKVSENMAKIVK